MNTILGRVGLGLALVLAMACTDEEPTTGGAAGSLPSGAGTSTIGHGGLAGSAVPGGAGAAQGGAAPRGGSAGFAGSTAGEAGAGGEETLGGSAGSAGSAPGTGGGGRGGWTGLAGTPPVGGGGAAGTPEVGMAGTGGVGGSGSSLCQVPQRGPTIHDAAVTTNEVWTADSGPHIVTGNLSVSGKLRIEACARVELDAGVSLTVDEQGTLATEGEPGRPVVFTGHEAGRWDVIDVAKTARLAMTHTIIERAGGDADSSYGCSILLDGDYVVPPVAMASLSNVQIVGSAGYGLCLRGTAALDASSSNLEIIGSGAESASNVLLEDAKCPVWLSPEAMGSIPSGNYTGNALDAICVDVQSDVEGEVTVQDRGVPYYFYYGGWPSVSIFSGGALNLGPGVIFKFDPQMSLRVSGGTLRAEGTVDHPVVFTSMAPSPAPGGWVGLTFSGTYSADTLIDHARIENAGANCSCVGFSCHSDYYPSEAAVILGDLPPRSFITNTTFANISGHGVNRGWQSDEPAPDFTVSNTFLGVSLCTQTTPTPETRACPSPLVCP